MKQELPKHYRNEQGKENKGEQPEQERAKCEACEGTGEDQCFGLKCLRCDGTGIEPVQPFKMQEKDWKEKFEYWLINNLQFTSKVHRIIDHVERYIIPAAQPSKVQEKEIGGDHLRFAEWCSDEQYIYTQEGLWFHDVPDERCSDRISTSDLYKLFKNNL